MEIRATKERDVTNTMGSLNGEENNTRLESYGTVPTSLYYDNEVISETDESSHDFNEEKKSKNWWVKTKQFLNWFNHSQLLAHILLIAQLFTFGGLVVLIPHSITIMHPTTFAMVRSLIIVIGLIPVTVIKDSSFSFRSEKVLKRKLSNIHNGIIRKIFEYILRKTPNWKQFKQIFLLGMYINLNQIFFLMGLRWTNATIAGIMQPLVAIITCIISVLLKREGKSILKFIGIFMAIGGAIAIIVFSTLFNPKKRVIINDADPSHLSTIDELINSFSFSIGMIVLCINVFCFALYLISFKSTFQKEKIPVMTLVLWTWIVSFLATIIPSLYFLTADYGYSPIQIVLRMDSKAYLGLFYAGLIHGSLFFVFNAKTAEITSPTIIAIYNTINPIVSSVMAFVILGERVTPLVIPGAALIVFGVVVVIVAKGREGKMEEKKENQVKDYKEDL